MYVSSWKLGIYLSSRRRAFRNTPKKQKANVPHYLTYPQPDPKKSMPKGLGRTPGHGAARTRGLESPADMARRMATFEWNDSPQKISMSEEESHFSSTCMFQCSWFLVVLVTLILSWWLTSWCSLFRGTLSLRRFARLGKNEVFVYVLVGLVYNYINFWQHLGCITVDLMMSQFHLTQLHLVEVLFS